MGYLINMYDITNFMTWFLTELLKLVSNIYSFLNNITFMGISILDFTITCLIISVVINIMLTLVTSNGTKDLNTKPARGRLRDRGKSE